MKLRTLLPVEDFVITTKLPVDEIRKRLLFNVEPKDRAARAASKYKLGLTYCGDVLDSSFSISRIINYRNSFLPVIKGTITEGYGKTLIQVKMRPVTGVLIFMSFWLGIIGLVCIGITLVAIVDIKDVLHGQFSPGALIPFGMFVFGFLLMTFSFKGEAKESKDFLIRLFDAQETM